MSSSAVDPIVLFAVLDILDGLVSILRQWLQSCGLINRLSCKEIATKFALKLRQRFVLIDNTLSNICHECLAKNTFHCQHGIDWEVER